MTDIQSVWPAELDLGEGPLWHAATHKFYFVDIHGCAVLAWNPTTGTRETWKMPERIGWIIPRTDGDGFMAGFQSGFARLWLEPVLRVVPIGCPHPGLPDVRLNDAKADRCGRIWAGSMNNVDPSLRQGQLTRLDGNGQFTVVESGIYIANGPAIASDGAWMLHNDSYTSTTYRYRITDDGQLAEKAVWRKFSADEGSPDGMTMDAAGNIWIAFWGGGCLRQFSPDARQLRQIDLPAPQVTSMAFGGDSLDLLLVTTARNGMTAAQLEQHPLAGSVFAVDASVVGLLPSTYGS